MQIELPTCDDRPVWDAWLSAYQMPTVATADEIRLFEALDAAPATAAELAERKGWNAEALKAMLPMLSALGFLTPRLGRYQLTPAARTYLLHDSPFYWATPSRRIAGPPSSSASCDRSLAGAAKETLGPADSWEAGDVSADMAKSVATFMHSHSVPAALGSARQGDFAGVNRLLDVGGGSGCFAIALAERFDHLRATVMELPTMCDLAKGYIAEAGLTGRVDTTSVDMSGPPGQGVTTRSSCPISSTTGTWTPTPNSPAAPMTPCRPAVASICTRC
ncbi:MAG: methyltransferase [Caulobacteraceae bacterium]